MSDEDRTCERCGLGFRFTAGEQRFFALRGLPDAPRRCAPCRKILKAERRSFPMRAPKPRPSVPSCSWCGEPARVPFEVALHRPVACEPCYRWRLGASSGVGMGTRS